MHAHLFESDMPVLELLKFITTHPLNSDHKTGALARFAKWQIASRLLHTDVVFDWVNGARFFARSGETGLTKNIYTGLHEFADMAYVLHVLRYSDLFVDVGSNVGSYTLLACRAVGAAGCAIEPIPHTYTRLQENIRLNHLENNVLCLNVGIGRAPGTIRFTAGLDAFNHVLADGENDPQAIDVEVFTLDSILKDRRPSLMKIDVEGYETAVLEGAAATLRKESLHSVLMELRGCGARYSYEESRIPLIMREHGFASYTYEPFSRSLQRLNGKALGSGSTLFLRNLEHIDQRLRTSPKVAVLGKEF